MNKSDYENMINEHGTAIIPDGTTEIDSDSFQNNNNVRRIRVPDSVNKIGAYAFANCPYLIEVRLPKGLNKVSDGLFYGDNEIKRIEMPKHITEIGDNAFGKCTSLSDVDIPSGVYKIGESAFENCAGLKNMVLPNGLKEIANSLFDNCYNMETVNIPDSVSTIGKRAFWGTKLSHVKLNNGITFIEDDAFGQCENLKAIYGEVDSDYKQYAFIPYHTEFKHIAEYESDMENLNKPVVRDIDGEQVIVAEIILDKDDSLVYRAKSINDGSEFYVSERAGYKAKGDSVGDAMMNAYRKKQDAHDANTPTSNMSKEQRDIIKTAIPGKSTGEISNTAGMFIIELSDGINNSQSKASKILNAENHEIVAHIGDTLGLDESNDKNHKLYISKDIVSNDKKNLVVVFDGFSDYDDDMNATFNAVKDAVKDSLSTHGESATLSDFSHITKSQLHQAALHYSAYSGSWMSNKSLNKHLTVNSTGVECEKLNDSLLVEPNNECSKSIDV